MATDIERLVVSLSADIKSYENAMRRAVGVTNSQVKAIENRYKAMNRTLAQSLQAPIAGLGAALSTREVLRYADAWTSAGNLIRAAATASGVQVRSLEELRSGADAARVSLDSYAGLYANLIRSASGVASSEAEIARATDLVSKAMKAGGASTAEQTSAIQQLGQALTSGVLQGDELRSLRENAPVLAAAIAKEFEVTVGGLKQLGEDGKLTADRVFKAILNYGPEIEAQFRSTNQTIAEGFTAVGNALTQYIGVMAQSVGLTTTVNAIMGALAGNIDTVANAAAAAGVVLLSSYAPALARVAGAQALVLATNPFLLLATGAAAATVALTAFGDEIQPVAGEISNLQDYTGSVWDTIVSGASTVASQTSEVFLKVINGISDLIGGVEVSWTDVGSFVKDVINGMIGGVVALYELVKANFTALPNVIAAAVVGAMNAMISTVEAAINQVVSEINGINRLVNGASSAVGLGNLVPELNKVQFGRFKNDYVSAAKDTGKAAAQAIADALSTDYLGDAFSAVQRGANVRALDRRSQARDARDSGTPISTAGYGTGMETSGADDGGSGKKGKKAKKDDLTKEIEQITKKTAALRAQTEAQAALNPLVDDYGYAVAKATALQDLETAAKEAGITLTVAQRAEMEKLAEAYGRAVEEQARLDEAQQRLRDTAEEWRQLSQDASRGFVDDLIAGKGAADALANALQKVANKLLDMAFNSAFDSKGGIFGNLFSSFSGSASTAPGAGGIVSALYHNGGVVGFGGSSSGKAYSPALWANAPRYHNGGIAGLKPNEVPAILQRGEKVIPNGGSREAGSQMTQVIINNPTGNSEIERAVTAGMKQAVAQAGRNAPGIVANMQRRTGRVG